MSEIVKFQDNHNSNSGLSEISTPEHLISSFFLYLDCLEQTVRTYRYGIKQFMKYLKAGNTSKPTRETILSYKKELTSRGLKPSTIALYLSSLRRLFSWSASNGFYPNITDGIKSPKQQQTGHKRDYLSGGQIQAMLKQTQSNRDNAMIALISSCRLRTVEVIRANVEDIRILGDTTVLYVQGKGRSDKTEFVKLSEPVVKAIQEYLSSRGQVSGNEPLFVSESRCNKGHRLTTRTVSGVCKKAMKTSGYDSPRLTAHSLRHSVATLALLAGVELTDVSAFMRHSNIGVIMVYAHNVNRLKSLCESAITRAIFGERLSA